MRTGAMAVSLVFIAAGCAKPPPDVEMAVEAPAQSSAPLPNTGQLSVHVKGMTKALHLF